MWLRASLITILSMVCWGCIDDEFDPNDPQKSFGIAREPYDDEYYDLALTRLGEFKSRFPYSKYAVEAELLIANSYFQLGKYVEAADAYRQFAKLHPKHPKVDFALFRVGEAYWEDAPEEIDREQDFTKKAITEWETLIEAKPNSEYSKKANEFVTLGKRRIAESIAFISEFYCKQELYHACAYRSLQLIEDYAAYADLRLAALDRAILSLDYLAEGKAKDPESDKNLYFQSMSAKDIQDKANKLKSIRAKMGS